MKKNSSVVKHILPRLKDILRKKDIKIKKLKRLSGGVVNEVYLLNNKFILRINTRDKHLRKFKNEFEILKKIKEKSDLQVPSPIIFTKIKKFEVLITSKINGKMPSSSRQAIKLAKPLAQTFKKLHSIKSNYFGTFDNKFSTWPKYVYFKLNKHIKEAINNKALDVNRINQVKEIFKRNQNILSEIKNKYLVHGDPSFTNILYSNNKITGIIDFEWSIFGDPAYDFAVLELAVEEYNPIKNTFEKYYGALDEHFERRKDLCKIMYLVELINVDKLHWKSKFRGKMLEQLDELINKLLTKHL